MTNRKLYIIGNGFDLQHGMKSKYSDFREYLIKIDENLVENLEKYFGYESLWSEFEETLSELDTERIKDECMVYFVQYGADNWSESANHDYQYEIEKRIDIILRILKNEFREWILQLEIPEISYKKVVDIDKNAVFINFNYTTTLEDIYKVSEKNIFYIHNKAIDCKSVLVLGHCINQQNVNELRGYNYDEDIDIRLIEGDQILNKYFKDTYKSTQTIIDENIVFFNSLISIENIYVFGHSLSNVDKPYFEHIVKKISRDTVIWNVSINNTIDLENHKIFFEQLGIKSELINYNRISEFDSRQLRIFN